MKTGTGFVFQNITAERNKELLKMCIQMAAALKARGDAPFAALLADENGDVLLEQDTLVYKNGDNTAHAESVLSSRASQKFSEEFLWKCSLYIPRVNRAVCAQGPSIGPTLAGSYSL